jgi:predicted ATPase/signal transduction histidine kinase
MGAPARPAKASHILRACRQPIGGPLIGNDETCQEIHRGRLHLVQRISGADGAHHVVKTVLDDVGHVAQAVARLRSEHALLATLDLPGVVKTLGFDEHAGQPALLLQDVGAQNLKQWQRRRPLSPDKFLTLAIAITEATAGLHARNIIHGDLNPSNIVIDADERITLIDFETAMRLSEPEPTAGQGPWGLPYTLPYAAPERTGRMNRPVDKRADLYSLGATFYELLVGAPPFAVTDPIELVHAHLARMPRPPRQANPNVPALLSDLVLRLLAKMPEQRYQSARGLLSDLLLAQARLQAGDDTIGFELGLVDLAHALPLPDRLHGRQAAHRQLSSAWQRAAAGERVTVSIVGEAGVGKSALILALRDEVADRGGNLALGKFDLRLGHTPYGPLVQALRDLLAQLTATAESRRTSLGERVTLGLGPTAPLLTTLLPELAELIDIPAPAPALPETAAGKDERFLLGFVALLRALASPEHPLVICVDDLHWADEASLTLLDRIAATPDLPGLLLVGTCRPEATLPGHPARATVTALGGPDRGGSTLELGPLDSDDLRALCAEALGCDAETARPLTELLGRKTGGNPFFARRLLRFLQQTQLLTVDPASGRWTWDLHRIEEIGVTDNVADLMVHALVRLPAPIQTTLNWAACVGSTVSAQLLAAVRSEPTASTSSALWMAAREGMLVPLAAAPGAPAAEALFAFAHDRIQQAAYGLCDDRTRAQIHLQIGRHLARCLPAAGNDQGQIFAAADQLMLGASDVFLPAEQIVVAQLLQRAADKARGAAAYAPALHYLTRAIKLLPKDIWTTDHRFAADLHRDAMSCAYVSDQLELGQALFEVALSRAWSRAEKASLYVMRIDARIARKAMADGVALTIEALRLFDVDLEVPCTPAVIEGELAEITVNRAGRTMEQVLLAPPSQDPDLLAHQRLLQRGLQAVYALNPAFWPLLVARVVNLSLVHGSAPSSGPGYVSYGVLLLQRGDHAGGTAFAKLGLALAERNGDPVQLCRAATMYGAVISSWCEPLQSRIPLLRRAQSLGIESGEFLFAASVPVTIVTLLFHKGVELSRVLVELEAALAGPHVKAVEHEYEVLLAYRQAVFRLSGLSTSSACIERDSDALGSCQHEILRLGLAYVMRDFDQAHALSASGRRLLVAPYRSVVPVEHNFYTSLTLLATCPTASPPQRQQVLAEVASNQEALSRWSTNAPQNFAHKHLLVMAEVARVEGRGLDAAELYEQAIAAAGEQRFIQDEALAHELAGRFHRVQGRERFARRYLRGAVEAYQRWGARAKACALEEEFLDLVNEPSFTGYAVAQTGSAVDTIDHDTLLRVAEALSREVVLERLMAKLMEISFATAGAERGALLLADGDRLTLRATGSATEATTLSVAPLSVTTQVPITVIERVRATLQPLVLADAAQHPQFRNDPYVAKHQARSVLALPILRQGQLVGVLYLENNLVTRMFTPDRLELLRLLSAQIANALENSLLFERLTQQIEERKRAEAAVRFLADAGAALSESLDYQATLNELARLAVPSLADWCVVDVVDGDRIRRVAWSHVDPAAAAQLGAPGDEGVGTDLRRQIAQVLSTRSPLLYDETAPSGPATEGGAALAATSSMILPLVARGRSVGAMCLVSSSPHRRFSATDLSLAQELARRAAVAIDNARLYHEAQEAVRLRDEFLSIASHELNTPIASLWLVVQGIEEAPTAPPPAALSRSIQVISRQTRRLKTLIGDLLDLAHIHTGQLRLRCDDVDLAAVVRDTIDRFSEDLIRARCTVALDAEAGVIGLWDRSRMEQVITNLLANAIKFGPGKPVEITVRARGNAAQLVVSDHGIGIAAESLPLIFGRFERAVSSANYGGLGLGLYIVQEIVQAHGGQVRVESQLGAGCTFMVELPRRDPRVSPLPGGVTGEENP